MTTPRKRTPKAVAKVEEPPTDTLTTFTVEIETDPSLLYPPVPASKAVGFGVHPIQYKREEVPKWKTYLTYAPFAFGALILIVGVWALTI
jgi:hypothetical protein